MNRNRILSPVLAAALIAPMSLPAMAQTADVNVDGPSTEGTTEAGTIGVDGELTASGNSSSNSTSDNGSSNASNNSGDSSNNASSNSSGDATSASSDTNSSASGDENSGTTGNTNSSSSGDMTADPLIVKVGDTEITASDVQTAIEAFPPQLAQQVPPEQLISVAVDQLVLRELILQRAEQENLSEDPEVQQMIEENSERSREDAIVQVYVQRALEDSVSDEAVQSAYDEAASQTEQELPTLEQVRPQIEQQLRQERLGELRQDLIDQGTEIVFYDENGEPIEDGGSASSAGAMSGSTNNGASNNNATSSSGGTSNDGNTSNSGGTSNNASTSNNGGGTSNSGGTSTDNNTSGNSSSNTSQ